MTEYDTVTSNGSVGMSKHSKSEYQGVKGIMGKKLSSVLSAVKYY